MAGTELFVVLFGLSSALSWGAGDFSGGYASRRSGAFTVVLLSQLVSLLLLTGWFFLSSSEPFSLDALIYGVIAGLCGAVGLVALYTGLARGPMGITAPLTAVVAAVVPVMFGITVGGLPDASDTMGIIIALPAVWAISGGNESRKTSPANLGLPLIAGLGFGLFFILFARASREAIVLPLIFARSSSIIIIFLVGLLQNQVKKPDPRSLLIICLAGILDTGGNLFFALANRFGRLDIVAVLSSFYPAATVFLAWILLNEKLTRRQWIGVVIAILAVILIAV
jgi:drug/metabolite transporter (DMT)-like permease